MSIDAAETIKFTPQKRVITFDQWAPVLQEIIFKGLPAVREFFGLPEAVLREGIFIEGGSLFIPEHGQLNQESMRRSNQAAITCFSTLNKLGLYPFFHRLIDNMHGPAADEADINLSRSLSFPEDTRPGQAQILMEGKFNPLAGKIFDTLHQAGKVKEHKLEQQERGRLLKLRLPSDEVLTLVEASPEGKSVFGCELIETAYRLSYPHGTGIIFIGEQFRHQQERVNELMAFLGKNFDQYRQQSIIYTVLV